MKLEDVTARLDAAELKSWVEKAEKLRKQVLAESKSKQRVPRAMTERMDDVSSSNNSKKSDNNAKSSASERKLPQRKSPTLTAVHSPAKSRPKQHKKPLRVETVFVPAESNLQTSMHGVRMLMGDQ